MEKDLAYLEWLSSPLFHNFWAERKEKETQAFINQLIQYLQPKKGSRVLDSSCGQGLNSMHLTTLGFEVTGVDRSTTNIEWALKREQNNPEFYQHDIRLPFWGNYFHLALNLADGFGYYRTRRENEAAFRTIASSLQPRGLFVIDYPNSHYPEQRPDEFNFTKTIGQHTYQFGLTPNETHFLYQIRITSPSLQEPKEFIFEQARISLDDFTAMLASHKMQVKEVFGTYSLNSYDPTQTPRMVLVAEKK
jgi:SAM-dependent methyltransferase